MNSHLADILEKIRELGLSVCRSAFNLWEVHSKYAVLKVKGLCSNSAFPYTVSNERIAGAASFLLDTLKANGCIS